MNACAERHSTETRMSICREERAVGNQDSAVYERGDDFHFKFEIAFQMQRELHFWFLRNF